MIAILVSVIFIFIFNMAMASSNVSRRRFGWATAYALSAIWAALYFAALVGAA